MSFFRENTELVLVIFGILSYKWFVPFTYSVEKLGTPSGDASNINTENLYSRVKWLKETEDSKVIQLDKPLTDDGFILANLDVAGFFRINYDLKSWENIIQQLIDDRNVFYFAFIHI